MALLQDAHALISALRAADLAFSGGDLDKASAALTASAPLLARFEAEAHGAACAAATRTAELATRAMQLSQTIAEAKAQIDAMQLQINTLHASLAHDRESLNQKLLLSEGRRNEIARLQADMAQHLAKLEELRSYWWVPGYGAYLAIDSLVENDIGALKTSQTALATTETDAARLQSDLSALQSQLDAAASRLTATSTAEANAMDLVQRANRELALVKSRAGYAEAFRARAARLKLLVEHLADHDMASLQEALSQVLTIKLEPDALLVTHRVQTFENSLLTLALAVDQQADFLTFDPPAGAAVVVRNRAGYFARCRVVLDTNPAQTSNWTDFFALTQEVQLRLSQAPFQAGELVFIEVDVKFGGNTRSAAILTVQDDFAVAPLAARLTNTIFNASFELEV